MWNRKNRFEQGLDTAETNVAHAVSDLADTIRQKVDTEQGKQLASALTNFADRVDALDLSDQVVRSRKEIQKAAKKAKKQARASGKQIAAISAQAVPEQPSNWIAPTFIGFLLGFGAGFFAARLTSSKSEQG
jgi:hypothetical protein